MVMRPGIALPRKSLFVAAAAQTVSAVALFKLFHTLWVVNTAFLCGFSALNVVTTVVLFVGAGFWRRRRSVVVPSVCLLCFAFLWLLLYRMAFDTIPQSTCHNASIQYYVMTIPRNAQRLAAFTQRMRLANVSCVPANGIDASQYANMAGLLAGHPDLRNVNPRVVPADKYVGNAVLILGFWKTMLFMLSHSSPQTEWVALFEDDAFLYKWSLQGIKNAACFYKAADVVWLDMRGAPDWYFLKQCRGGMAGTLFRRASLAKLAQLMRIDGEPFQSSLTSYNSKSRNDDFLAHMCNSGAIQCALSPMVRETGDESTHVNIDVA